MQCNVRSLSRVYAPLNASLKINRAMEMVLISVVFILSPSDKVDKPSSLCQAPQGPSLQYSEGKQHQPIPTPLPPPIVTYPPLPPCGALCLHRPEENALRSSSSIEKESCFHLSPLLLALKGTNVCSASLCYQNSRECLLCVRWKLFCAPETIRSTMRLFSRKGTGAPGFWLTPCVPVVSSAPVSQVLYLMIKTLY